MNELKVLQYVRDDGQFDAIKTDMIILINKTSIPCKRFLSAVTKKVNKYKSHENI